MNRRAFLLGTAATAIAIALPIKSSPPINMGAYIGHPDAYALFEAPEIYTEGAWCTTFQVHSGIEDPVVEFFGPGTKLSDLRWCTTEQLFPPAADAQRG